MGLMEFGVLSSDRTICYIHLNEIWDPTPESKLLIVGLLRAMKEILEQLGSVHAIVFLRSDIYESLEFHDSDKFHVMVRRLT
jgi:hypothetical protein